MNTATRFQQSKGRRQAAQLCLYFVVPAFVVLDASELADTLREPSRASATAGFDRSHIGPKPLLAETNRALRNPRLVRMKHFVHPIGHAAEEIERMRREVQ